MKASLQKSKQFVNPIVIASPLRAGRLYHRPIGRCFTRSLVTVFSDKHQLDWKTYQQAIELAEKDLRKFESLLKVERKSFYKESQKRQERSKLKKQILNPLDELCELGNMRLSECKHIQEFQVLIESSLSEVLLGDICTLLYGANKGVTHPGMLIHDSPREADMGDNLYQKYEQLLVQLQQLCASQDAYPFQYIVTTTAKPAPELREGKMVKWSRPAIKKICERAYRQGDGRYERLATLSISHLYHLRQSTTIQKPRLTPKARRRRCTATKTG